MYFQVLQLLFANLSKTDMIAKMPIIKDNKRKTTFSFYVDRYLSFGKILKNIYKFLHKTNYLYNTFG